MRRQLLEALLRKDDAHRGLDGDDGRMHPPAEERTRLAKPRAHVHVTTAQLERARDQQVERLAPRALLEHHISRRPVAHLHVLERGAVLGVAEVAQQRQVHLYAWRVQGMCA